MEQDPGHSRPKEELKAAKAERRYYEYKKRRIEEQRQYEGTRLARKPERHCHALTLVIFVFFIILVRSGCDEGGMCFFPCFLYIFGVLVLSR